MRKKGDLGGFGGEWRPTLHLDVVNALNGSGESPEGKAMIKMTLESWR